MVQNSFQRAKGNPGNTGRTARYVLGFDNHFDSSIPPFGKDFVRCPLLQIDPAGGLIWRFTTPATSRPKPLLLLVLRAPVFLGPFQKVVHQPLAHAIRSFGGPFLKPTAGLETQLPSFNLFL
jgi:hypothetical protein